MKNNKIIVMSSISLLAAGTAGANMWAGPGHLHGGGQMHNMNNMHDNQRAAARAIEHKRNEDAKREAERAAKERQDAMDQLERENAAIRAENDRVQGQLAEQKRILDARMAELNKQREAGTFKVSSVTTEELIHALRNEKDPEVQEYWATMIVLLDPKNEEAISFLRDVRHWTDAEIDGLNMTNREEL